MAWNAFDLRLNAFQLTVFLYFLPYTSILPPFVQGHEYVVYCDMLCWVLSFTLCGFVCVFVCTVALVLFILICFYCVIIVVLLCC